jgi:hypothetical protein
MNRAKLRGQLLSRRTVLQGAGALVALPWLDATGLTSLASAAESSEGKPPRRMAFLYVPNGIHMADWTPKSEGTNYELPAILKPLEKVRENVMVLSGLVCDKARANGDGAGDHARASAAFLTGAQPRKTSGANFRAGMSADQAAAQQLGDRTRLPSLELGIESFRGSGNCDSGYSCVYQHTLAWRSPTSPLPTETNPRLIFDRLFAERPNDPARIQRDKLRASVLDAVLPPVTPPEGAERPAGSPANLTDHLRLVCDLLVLAFQADVTRIGTFMLAREGSNTQYRVVGVSEGHHEITHHRGDPVLLEKIKKINTFHMEQFAYLLEKLQGVREGDGTLLDNCMIAYGSAIEDGNRHSHHNVPLLLAGKGGGSIKSGRHVRITGDVPLNNLWLSMLDRMGAPTAKLGDSTGLLEGLA